MALVRPQTVTPRLAEIGRLFKGAKKTSNRPGEDLTHFRFEPAQRTYDLPSPNGNGTLAQYLIERFLGLGDEPRSIPVRFLHSSVSKVFTSTNEVWATLNGRSRCVRRCNGEIQSLHLDGGNRLSRTPVKCQAAAGATQCPNKCKPTGRLSMILPDLQYPGAVILTTHSIHDIIEITGNLQLYESWDLSKVPFRLCRTNRTVQYQDPKGNGLKSMERYLCHVEIDPAFGSAVLASQSQQHLAQLTGTNEPEADLEDEVIDGEFTSEIDNPPYDDNAVWLKFLELLSRANGEHQLEQAQAWLQLDNQWRQVETLPDINLRIDAEIAQARQSLPALV